ncbi:hypothetical protein RchiOBHm_Chr6g0304571 [Rosa chinensis]|uniref:Uncharacterized protein n=1 Tax=Rosa chinensis TaxID=74649 RepID=A0A2P6PZK3_ROSCH|nr:hypothetical protein RchiOBHm_Chr6g0304571 [Rosa chinensis]
MKIAVPVKVGFTEFVKITKDPSTKRTVATGFSIDVCEAALEMLPYALPYEFIPFAKSDGSSAGTNNDLCYQLYRGVQKFFMLQLQQNLVTHIYDILNLI